MTDELYDRWLANVRQLTPPAALTDQIMSQVVELESQRRDIRWLCLVQRIERWRVGRWAVYSGALAIGGLPFVFLVYVAQVVIF